MMATHYDGTFREASVCVQHSGNIVLSALPPPALCHLSLPLSTSLLLPSIFLLLSSIFLLLLPSIYLAYAFSSPPSFLPPTFSSSHSLLFLASYLSSKAGWEECKSVHAMHSMA